MNHRFGTFALTLCLGLLVAAGSAQAELKVGDDAPAFEMKGSDGKTYKSSDFNGCIPLPPALEAARSIDRTRH